MIDKEELHNIAKLKGLSIQLAELDYLQDVALINISREFGKKLVFKGGTCLYKVYQLNRFSEDLDFSAVKGFKPKKFFHHLPYLFSLLNITARVKVEHFEKSLNVYLDTMGPLYRGRKETLATLFFNISLRERVLMPVNLNTYAPFYKEIRPFDLAAMDEREILAEKVRAIYTRNKARDVYDLWHLIKRGLNFDYALINKKLSGNLKFDKDTFMGKIDEKKSSWEKDLSALVAGQLPSFKIVREIIEPKIIADN